MMRDVRVSLRLGDGWAREFTTNLTDPDDPRLAAPGGEVLDGLRASWTTPGEMWPAQPSPVTVSFALYVPDITATTEQPDPREGREVALFMADPDWDPAVGNVPFFEFYGRMTDVEASPAGTRGMRYDIVAVDYLAELNEETGGDYVLGTANDWVARFDQIRAAHPELPIEATFSGGYAPILRQREPSPAPVGALLEELLGDVSEWYDPTNFILNPADPTRFPTSRWERPIMAYRYFGPGSSLAAGFDRAVTFNVGRLTQAVQVGLRYRLTADPATGAVSRVLATDDDPSSQQLYAILPAAAVELGSLRWYQDKRRRPNRVRLTGVFDRDDLPGGGTATATVRRWASSVRQRGPVEASKASLIYYRQQANATTLMYLGDEFRTRPGWSLGAVTVLPQAIADGDAWPRLFPGLLGDLYPAAGKLALVTGIPGERNKYGRPDYPGRLIGAELELRGGIVRATAHLLHDVPTPNGLAAERLTAASLAADPALGDPTASDFGPITAIDLRLTGA